MDTICTFAQKVGRKRPLARYAEGGRGSVRRVFVQSPSKEKPLRRLVIVFGAILFCATALFSQSATDKVLVGYAVVTPSTPIRNDDAPDQREHVVSAEF